ncbi:MAG TPA: LysE family translocator [Polyangiales bacterium]|nr:LysE family translocator [Polyangiales bacterium]
MTEALSWIIGITTLCMLSPGPDMILVMRNTLAGDRRSGLLTSLGVLTGNLVHITYCMLGLGWLIANSIAAYSVLKFAGAAYLLYLGWSSIRSSASEGAHEAPSPQRSDRGAYVQGLLNNLLNPKGALFYLGVFTQLIHPDTPPARSAVLVAAMVTTSALFWVLFVHGLALPPVRVLLQRSRKTVDGIFGALLIALGLRVALRD